MFLSSALGILYDFRFNGYIKKENQRLENLLIPMRERCNTSFKVSMKYLWTDHKTMQMAEFTELYES